MIVENSPCPGITPRVDVDSFHLEDPTVRKSPRLLFATQRENLELLVLGQNFIPYLIDSGTRGAFYVDHRGLIMGFYIAENWTPTSVQLHYALPNPFVLRYRFFENTFKFLFDTCHLEVLIGMTPGHNTRALRLNRHVGFKEKYRVINGYDVGVDYVLMELRREDATRWLGENDG